MKAQCVDQLSWKQFESRMKRTDTATIPVGAIEAHGLHAPIGLDSFVAYEIAKRLAEKTGSMLFPVIKYGVGRLVYDVSMWPGTISISPEVLEGLCTNIGKELANKGIRKIVFVNGHGPNSGTLEISAYRIWNDTGTAVGILEWWSAAAKEVKAVKGVTYGTHADEVETSLLLTSEGAGYVNLKKARANPSAPNVSENELEMYLDKVRFTHELDRRWIGDSGNYGNPKIATREKGEKIVDETVRRGIKLIEVLEGYVRKRKAT